MSLQITDPNYPGYMLPTVMNPPDSLCFTVKVPNDQGHIAAFFGALFELTQWISWQRDSAKRGKDAAAVWRAIWVDLAAQSCDLPKAPHGAEIEDFMPLRVDCDCNVFVTCCDGTEKQLLTSDQVKALIDGSAQNGAPQPQPGGGCQPYPVTIVGGQLQIIPTVVNSGDTITLNSATGASTQDGVGWQCPDGEIYFAGACAGGGVTNPGAYVPAAKIGRPVLFLNGVYYDLTIGTPFTVPGGVVNQTPMLVLNYVSTNVISGTVNCTVTVCNNVAGTWSKTINFLLTSCGAVQPVPTRPTWGSWVPGTGMDCSTASFAGCNQVRLEFQLNFGVTTTLTHIDMEYNLTAGLSDCGSSDFVSVFLNNQSIIVYNVATPSVPAGSNQHIVDNTVRTGITDLEVFFSAEETSSTPSGSGQVVSLTLHGTGTEPTFSC